VLQTALFGPLELELGPLSEKARLLVAVLATAFLAKAVYGLETTR
jgi:hypothetical protein